MYARTAEERDNSETSVSAKTAKRMPSVQLSTWRRIGRTCFCGQAGGMKIRRNDGRRGDGMTVRCKRCGHFAGDEICRLCHPVLWAADRVRFALWRARMRRRVCRRCDGLFMKNMKKGTE